MSLTLLTTGAILSEGFKISVIYFYCLHIYFLLFYLSTLLLYTSYRFHAVTWQKEFGHKILKLTSKCVLKFLNCLAASTSKHGDKNIDVETEILTIDINSTFNAILQLSIDMPHNIFDTWIIYFSPSKKMSYLPLRVEPRTWEKKLFKCVNSHPGMKLK